MPDTGASWRDQVEDAARDREHGATRIAEKAARGFAALDPDDVRREEVARALGELLEGQPAMGPVLNLATHLAAALAKDSLQDVVRAARLFLNKSTSSQVLFEQVFRGNPPDGAGERAWFLYSRSSVVLRGCELLQEEQRPHLAVVGRSLPGGEGELLASTLSEQGWKVLLLEDAALAEYLADGNASRLILGCDALDDRFFVNKVGSGALASHAARKGVEVELWTTSVKFLPPGGTDWLKPPPVLPLEDYPHAPAGRSLFGRGLLEDVARIRCDLGILSVQEAAERCRILPPLDPARLPGGHGTV